MIINYSLISSKTLFKQIIVAFFLCIETIPKITDCHYVNSFYITHDFSLAQATYSKINKLYGLLQENSL